MKEKKQLRIEARNILNSIPQKRRIEAKANLEYTLSTRLKEEKRVLSFSSLPHEIDTSTINEMLFEQKKLVLPKVKCHQLDLLLVKNITTLTPSNFSILEPVEEGSEKIFIESISLILVPALLFDPLNYRLGYGGGYYDKLLNSKNYNTLGIGFKEQLCHFNLPVEWHDVKLKNVLLF